MVAEAAEQDPTCASGGLTIHTVLQKTQTHSNPISIFQLGYAQRMHFTHEQYYSVACKLELCGHSQKACVYTL